MSLASRSYMRTPYHVPRLTTRLIIILLVAFVLQSMLLFYGDVALSENLSLSWEGLRHGKIWQLVTFQFLHACPWPWHVLFNCLGLYFFGRPVEEMVGPKKFLILYFFSGVSGGILQVLVTAILPRHADIPVVGASAGVCGMVAIFCLMNPMQQLTTWIYFFPINIQARFFLLCLTAFSVYGTLIPISYVAHAAHLGGILAGFWYVRYGRRFSEEFTRPAWLRWPLRRRRRSTLGAPGKISLWKRPPTPEPASVFISKEVDPILDKISAHGFASLTDAERKILEAARERMESRGE